MNPLFSPKTNDELLDIQDTIRYDMICKYRTILHVFSHEWLSIHQVRPLPTVVHVKPVAPSIEFDVRSTVFVKELRLWMQNIRRLMRKLQNERFLVV